MLWFLNRSGVTRRRPAKSDFGAGAARRDIRRTAVVILRATDAIDDKSAVFLAVSKRLTIERIDGNTECDFSQGVWEAPCLGIPGHEHSARENTSVACVELRSFPQQRGGLRQ